MCCDFGIARLLAALYPGDAVGARGSIPILQRSTVMRRGFSIIELLVALCVLVVLLAIFVPALRNAREAANRVSCGNNLKRIGDALSEYASDNGTNRNFPRVRYDSINRPAGYCAFTGPDDANPFLANSAVEPNDITASLWLLVRQGYFGKVGAKVGVFVCPSTQDTPDTLTDAVGKAVPVSQRGNFRHAENLSYSYASPFTNAYKFEFGSDALKGGFVLAADKNPGFSMVDGKPCFPLHDAKPFDLARGNSRNHGQAGQNVLYADGHVEWVTTSYCGVANDNIYTAVAQHRLEGIHPQLDQPGFIGHDIGPAYAYDSYLVPTAGEGPP